MIFINLVLIYQQPCLFTSRGWAEKEDVMLNRCKLINLFMSGEIQMMPMQDFSPLLQPTLSHLSHVCTYENVLDRNLHKLRLGIIIHLPSPSGHLSNMPTENL